MSALLPIPTLPFGDAIPELSTVGPFAFVGVAGPEERHRRGFDMSARLNPTRRLAIEIEPVAGAYPDLAGQWRAGSKNCRKGLDVAGIAYDLETIPLLATEDQILALSKKCVDLGPNLILDISSMPARVFGLLTSTLLRATAISELVVLYTEAGSYSDKNLTSDPQPVEPLPGFAGPLDETPRRLVVSLGFESLGLRDFLENEASRHKIKWLLPFPAKTQWMKRQWRAIQGTTTAQAPASGDLEYAPAWDVNAAFRALEGWFDIDPHLHLAPFGPKPHTLAMLLFAMEKDLNVSYSQPKSIRPDGTTGFGQTWSYLLKTDGSSVIR
ncbi:MAG: hypothetical protein ABI672_15270 [Vicinamibacteria bacterium]